jgi:DNA-binding beta-propeller fold protein YncE
MRARRAALAAVAALVAAVALAVPAQAAYVHVRTFGHEGKGPGQFGSGILGAGADKQWDNPAGIAVERNGNVLVVDVSNNRVERFTRDGRFLSSFGSRGRDAGFVQVKLTNKFFVPEGIAVDPAGNVYVADGGNDRVMKYTPRWHFLRRLTRTGSFPGEVVQPWGVAVGGGTVFVADEGNYEIDRFGVNGGWRGAFGAFGRAQGKLVHPYGVATTPRGDTVWVADYIRQKVIAYSGAGRFLGEFGTAGRGHGQFLKPAGVAVGPDGTLFVADRCNWRVQRFTAGGQFIESFGEGRLASPTFLAVDRTGRVYVSDYHRVAVFAPGARGARTASAPARAAHHNGIDIACRHVGPQYGAPDRTAPRR